MGKLTITANTDDYILHSEDDGGKYEIRFSIICINGIYGLDRYSQRKYFLSSKELRAIADFIDKFEKHNGVLFTGK